MITFPNRYKPNVLVFLVGFVAGLISPNSLLAQGSKAQPNIIFIISDDQSWNDYSFMGHPHINTPHIDALSEKSLLFKNGYVTTSLCCPSLATMITGLYPCQHKITGNEPPSPNGRRSQDFLQGRVDMDEIMRNTSTLPKMLKKVGYRSFQTGKWWHGGYELPGFDEGMTHGDPKRGGRHGDEGLKIGREGMKPIYDFIEKDKSKPFFLWHAPFLPHTPHNPPARLLSKYVDKAPSVPIAKYWAMCEWFDETCGELVNYLESSDLLENTVIFYITDNGWINQLNASRYAPKSKRSPYDGGLRTPIMVRWDGVIQPTVSNSLASSIDLVPTVLDILQIDKPQRLQGISLLKSKNLTMRNVLHGAIYLHDAHDIHEPQANLTHWWARNEKWKIIVPNPKNTNSSQIELYDLQTDPFEEKNLAGAENLTPISNLTTSILAWWGKTYLE